MTREHQARRAYLAGPEVFLPNVLEVGEKKKLLCTKYGFKGVYPADSVLSMDPTSVNGLAIAKANEMLIATCDFVVANVTPFRSPSADVGTVYEMGFARGQGMPVFAYSAVAQDFTSRTVAKFNVTRSGDGKFRDNKGLAIEEFGLVDNLMLDYSVRAGVNEIIVPEHVEPLGRDGDAVSLEHYGRTEEFERCLALAVKHFGLPLSGERGGNHLVKQNDE